MLGGLGALNKVGQAVAKSLPPSSASLYLDFTLGTLDSRITFTRGSQATLFNSAGTLVFAPNNLIRNNTMVGAVAGTPGTAPTNWFLYTALTGLTTEIVGTGADSGITYIDIRISGTPSAAGSYQIGFDSNTGIAALNGQTWAESAYLKLQAGSFTGITATRLQNDERSASAYIRTNASSPFTVTSAALNTQRFSFESTLSGGATVAFVVPYILLSLSGAAIDFTLRIGMPQLERGSVATAVNATSGTAYYGPRFDYDHSTLAARGLLIEEARTNSIRNNTMVGAVAGTPGTLPTNWTIPNTAGLTTNVSAIGTQNGISYIDVQVTGTTNATSYTLAVEAVTQIAALQGQTWTFSSWISLIAGDFTNVTAAFVDIRELNSGGSQLASGAVSISLPSSTFQRIVATRTNTEATTAFVQPRLRFTVNNASAVNFTLRIGLPQLELGAFATSVIPTTTTALTRNADVATMTGTNFSSWYNASEGTLFVEGSTAVAADTYIFADMNSGVTNNYIRQSTTSAGTTNQFVVQVTGSTLASPGVTVTLGSSRKMAGAYILDSVQQAVNGTLATEDTSVAIPTGLSQMNLGSRANSTNDSQVWLARIAYYPVRLANSQLQALTA